MTVYNRSIRTFCCEHAWNKRGRVHGYRVLDDGEITKEKHYGMASVFYKIIDIDSPFHSPYLTVERIILFKFCFVYSTFEAH